MEPHASLSWGSDREQAILRLVRALREYEIGGLKTTIPALLWLLRDVDFLGGRINTTFLDKRMGSNGSLTFNSISSETEEVAILAAALHTYLRVNADQCDGRRERSTSLMSWKRVGRFEGLRT